jgi:hypothetical protein
VVAVVVAVAVAVRAPGGIVALLAVVAHLGAVCGVGIASMRAVCARMLGWQMRRSISGRNSWRGGRICRWISIARCIEHWRACTAGAVNAIAAVMALIAALANSVVAE